MTKTSYVCIALAIALTPSLASAWTSGPENTPGPPDARCAQNVLTWTVPSGSDPNEHAEFLREAMQYAGLPPELYPSAPFVATTYVTSGGGDPGYCQGSQGVEPASITPVTLSAANGTWTRSYTIPGFASLPDHSYSLWDWAKGNETCPNAATDPASPPTAVQCHTFSSHLGPLNSTHFPPQSHQMYVWYHDIAMSRAQDCNDLYQKFSGNPIWKDANTQALSTSYVKECEREALLVEAIGQHYLQDNWAMGHMWQRWGGPQLNNFKPLPPYEKVSTLSDLEDARQRAVVVAFEAGLIHGSDALTEHWPQPISLDSLYQVVVGGVGDLAQHLFGGDGTLRFGGDQMSYGRDERIAWQFPVNPLALPLPQGVGDLYSAALETPTNPNPLSADPNTTLQGSLLIQCSAYGMLQVYSATAQQSGPISGTFPGPTPDLLGDGCHSQRATNQAIYIGMGLNVTTFNASGVATNRLIPVEYLMKVFPYLVLSLPQPLGASVDPRIAAQLPPEMIRNGTIAQYYATYIPEGTDLAQSGIGGDFMSVRKNEFFALGPAPDADPPLWPALLDPSIPLETPAENARVIARLFHKSHVTEWCTNSEASPTSLKQNAQNYAGTPNATAALAVCKEFVSRQVRLVDTQGNSTPSLCDAAGAGGNSVLGRSGGTDRFAEAEAYCAASGGKYSIAEMPTLYYPVQPVAINNAGQVVAGALDPAFNHLTVVVSPQGSIQVLGGGDPARPHPINDAGQVLFGDGHHTYLYTPGGSVQDIEYWSLTIGELIFYPSAINNSGQVVGLGHLVGTYDHAFLYSQGAVQDLGVAGVPPAPLSGSSAAVDINDLGQIAVYSTTGGTYTFPPSTSPTAVIHAFIYDLNGGKQDLNTLGGVFSYPSFMNSKGQVVGTSSGAGPNSYFLYTPGSVMQDLCMLVGTLSCGAVGMNNLGQVVGALVYPSAPGHSVPFLYSPQTGAVDVNTLLPSGSGWTVNSVSAINDKGQMVGSGTHNGNYVGFLMTPQ
jgi:probable HAF family extracellular repeat protein